MLTTGFNAPAVDLIAMLRPTKSAGLYVQIVGRGCRLAQGKTDCLILDFAGNIARHGPIDAIRPKRPGEGDGVAPTKTCPECKSILPTNTRVCPDCGHEFPPPKPNIVPVASTLDILTRVGPPEWVDVTQVRYARHDKPGKPPSLRVDYWCGLSSHREWVCVEHPGYPRQKAATWWATRAPDLPLPGSVEEALALAGQLRRPSQIAVRPSGRYTEVVAARF